MIAINIITGITYKPYYIPSRMYSLIKSKDINASYIDTIFSPCWIFLFHAYFSLLFNTKKYVSCLAGVDEQSLTPGLLLSLPKVKEIKIDEKYIIPDKIDKSTAQNLSWQYCKKELIRKNKILHKIPEINSVNCYKYYKPLYLYEIIDQYKQKHYHVIDSTSGEVDYINIIE